MGVFGIFWILILVVIAVWLFSYLKQQDKPPAGDAQDDALEILKQRYARGEISKEEYDEKKKTLTE